MLAIEAGCDGVLICSGDHDTQAAALEALVHAVEDRAAAARPRRGRAQAAAAREGAVPGVAGGGAAGRRTRAARRRSAATSTARSPRRWRASCDAQAARARPRRSPRRRRARQPVRPRRVRSRRRGNPPPRLRAGLRRLGVRAPALRRRDRRSARRGDSRGLARSVDRRPHRRARRLRQRAAAAAARSRRGPARRQAVHRLQRSDGDADVPHARLRARRVSRPDARRPAGPRRRGLRSRLVHARRSAGANRWASCAPAGLETVRAGEAAGTAARRDADAAAGVARHAVRVRAAGRATCCSSTKSASVRTGSIAW